MTSEAPIIPIDQAAQRERRIEERRELARKRSIERARADALKAVATAAITERGRELARLLSKYIGTTTEIQRTCSLIARLAARHCRLAERECSEEMSESEAARVELETARIEARVTALVEHLPTVDGYSMTPVFSGDPRGYTVKVRVPHRPGDGNTWGLGGDFGV